ncbi:MAG: glycosyltransferase family protein [Nitrospirae bacterium]|nr:glycosyltransferase family protein [Nitrospirota bacterium]
MKTVAIIEARMGSTRLPKKTLMDVAGATLLERVVERIGLARTVNETVVATSVNPGDDAIYELCYKKGIQCFRGSEDDVLGRVYEAARKHGADIILQCGADCPFYDPELIDLLAAILKWGGYSYAANDMKLTFPEGIDAHVVRFDALEASAKEAKDVQEREDTPRFIWNHPGRFPIFNLEALPGSKLNRPEIRLTVDYKEDMELAKFIYEKLYPVSPGFTAHELIDFLDGHPDWIRKNSHCEQRSAAYI